MAIFTVDQVIDGDTFSVLGGWRWETKDGTFKEGTVVRPTGYNTPEKGKEGSGEAFAKLYSLIKGKEVELKNAVDISYGRLVCEVYINGKNLADYFPECKN